MDSFTLNSRILYDNGFLINGVFKASLMNLIKDCAFNHSVEILSSYSEEELGSKAFFPPDLFFSAELDVSLFLRSDVIKDCVLKENMIALSHKQLIDKDNVAALLPNGKLRLSLVKDSYERLGLEGRPSLYEKLQKHIVEVDLLAKSFQSGKANYERVRRGLTENVPLNMEFVFMLDEDCGKAEGIFGAKRHICRETAQQLKNVKVPLFFPSSEEQSCSPEEMLNWIGALSCDINCEEGGPGVYESSFSTPEPFSAVKYLTRRKWEGMVHSKWIQSILEALWSLHSSNNYSMNDTLQISAITVWGFQDTPVTVGSLEHSYFLHGDNTLIILLINDICHVFRTLGTFDQIQ